ncbi:MAG: hypothetical protein NUV93_08705 [Firmicutes bacterium]|jgi:ZIP family zinc transporter|nr:hypothetical protein [Bacillota bacterium]
MDRVIMAALLGAVAGVVGTGVGGLVAAASREPDRRAFATLVGFSGGMMFAVTVFDLVPEALAADPVAAAVGAVVGAGFIVATDLIWTAGAHGGDVHGGTRYIRAGTVVGLGIAAHNFAEGLAVGSGYVAASRLGMEISLIIGIHDVPEGIAMATMLRLGRVRRLAVIAAASATGLPMAAGALLGALIGEISRAGLAFSLGCAGGAMLSVTFRLYPEGASLRRRAAMVSGTVAGLAAGAFLVASL